MGPISLLRSVFSLDVLDYRITADLRSSSPPKNRHLPSLSGPSSSSSSATTPATIPQSPQGWKKDDAEPSKWKSPEFFAYYFVFATLVPLMFKKAHDVSKGMHQVRAIGLAERTVLLIELESHPNFSKYQHLLSPGWIPGRKVDNSDRQYASFRNNIPILFALLALHFVLRRIFNFVFRRAFPTPPQNSSYRPNHNFTRRKLFDIIFALIFLTALHSLSVIKILVILLLNFSISFFHPSSILVPIITWVFNIGVLFANEYFKGYKFCEILPFLIAGEGEGVGYRMDHFMGGGILNRWEVSFNITVLRLISYNMDHYWAAVRWEEGAEREAGSVIEVGRLATAQHHSASEGERDGGEGTDPKYGNRDNRDGAVGDSGDEERLMKAEIKKKHADPANANERDRIETPARPEDYSLLNYLAYILYTPLYLAGPILTFNDFIHQVVLPLQLKSIQLLIGRTAAKILDSDLDCTP